VRVHEPRHDRAARRVDARRASRKVDVLGQLRARAYVHDLAFIRRDRRIGQR
jgi:hypothetical protein